MSAERVLVDRCVAGEPAAWRELHRIYYPCAAAFLRRLGVEDEELDDAAQEVFLRVHRYLKRFRGEARFRSWLYKLCVTESRRLRGRRHRTQTLLLWWRRDDATERVPGQDITPTGLRTALDAAMARMNERERVMFVLFELEAVSGAKIAEITGCSLAMVWNTLFRARRAFRDAINSFSAGGQP